MILTSTYHSVYIVSRITMKILAFSLVFISCALFPASGEVKTRLKYAKVVSHDPSYITVRFCYIKAYSRTLATFNLGFTFKKVLSAPLNVRIDISFRFFKKTKTLVSFEFFF